MMVRTRSTVRELIPRTEAVAWDDLPGEAGCSNLAPVGARSVRSPDFFLLSNSCTQRIKSALLMFRRSRWQWIAYSTAASSEANFLCSTGTSSIPTCFAAISRVCPSISVPFHRTSGSGSGGVRPTEKQCFQGVQVDSGPITPCTKTVQSGFWGFRCVILSPHYYSHG